MDRTFREGKSDVNGVENVDRFFFESYFVDFVGAGIRAPASNADWQQEFPREASAYAVAARVGKIDRLGFGCGFGVVAACTCLTCAASALRLWRRGFLNH